MNKHTTHSLQQRQRDYMLWVLATFANEIIAERSALRRKATALRAERVARSKWAERQH